MVGSVSVWHIVGMTVGTHRERRLLFGCPIPLDVAASVALTGLSVLSGVAQGIAQGVEAPANIVAAQIRSQGYACSAPVTAERDREASRPNAAVWILDCANARYRVHLVPNMAAKVTRLGDARR